jgi:integral membrane protein
MTETQNNNLKLLHTVGLYEGISFLVLLFIAMPLKYYADFPMAVRIVGSAHGLLFVVFLWFIGQCLFEKSISFKQALIAFGLGFLPAGTFFLKKFIQKP